MSTNKYEYKLAYRRVKIDPSVEEKAVEVLMKSGQRFSAGPSKTDYTISYQQCEMLTKNKIPYKEH